MSRWQLVIVHLTIEGCCVDYCVERVLQADRIGCTEEQVEICQESLVLASLAMGSTD